MFTRSHSSVKTFVFSETKTALQVITELFFMIKLDFYYSLAIFLSVNFPE